MSAPVICMACKSDITDRKHGFLTDKGVQTGYYCALCKIVYFEDSLLSLNPPQEVLNQFDPSLSKQKPINTLVGSGTEGKLEEDDK